jgi:hypothetical protein
VRLRRTQLRFPSGREFFAPYLRILFKLARVEDAASTVFTENPPPDAGVTKIRVNGASVRLGPGTVSYNMDWLCQRNNILAYRYQVMPEFVGKRSALFS